MYKNLIGTLLLTGIVCTKLLAQNYTLQTTTQMAPGIIYQKYTMTSPLPQEMHVLQIDLKDPTVKLQAAKAGNMINGGVQTVKAIAASKDVNEAYHNVIGAVNGDFFVNTAGSASKGNPLNLLLPDGQVFAEKTGTARSLFGIDANNNPFIALRAQQFRVIKNGVSTTIQKVNGTRTNDTLVLYNQYKGSSTGTDNTGTEVKIGLASGASWKANTAVQCVVLSNPTTTGNTSFSNGQAVLSGKGTMATYLNGFSTGDAITIQMDVASGVSNLEQVMGGFGRLVTSGSNTAQASILSEGGTLDNDTAHQPHTAVGISQDERFMYMAVVDGRDAGVRSGMSLTEFANLMIYLGAYNAINLDGGGSSTLLANNVVRNTPSDDTARAVGTALLAYSATQLLDGFENDEGHFNVAPTFTSGTQYTVGVATSSTMDRVTTNACSGTASERAILNDDATSSSNWTVRLLSGSGIPANNVSITSTGTLNFWLKTNTAQTGATVQVWFDDSDGAEASPPLTILNDGEWHQYSFDLNNLNGSTITTGNGQLDAANVTLDAIVLKQPNTSTSWTVYFDDLVHNKTASGTKVGSQNKTLDDFEAGVGHFNEAPGNTAGGTQYTVGISTSSTLQRVTTDKHRGFGGLRATLVDDASSTSAWTVRLLSGSGMPSNNVKITSDGTLSFWMKTATAQSGATLQVWFDDSDGAEASPALNVINDGQWHLYHFNLDNFNGTTITTGNGQLDGSLITLDAIVLKQPNTSTTWTVYFDDVMHLAAGDNPGTIISPRLQTQAPIAVVDEILIYPNPAKGKFSLQLPLYSSEKYAVDVYNVSGAKVFARIYNGGLQGIDCTGLPAGVYVVNVHSQRFRKTTKIVITQ